jgi:alpha-galactosidase
VETNAHFSAGCLRPVTSGSLPAGLAPLVNLHCANQDLIIEAALAGDSDLAFQAFLNDPTNHLPIDLAWELYNRMLQVSREYLPSMKFTRNGRVLL